MLPVFDNLGNPIQSREDLDAMLAQAKSDSSRNLYDADGYALATYEWPPELNGEPFEPSDDDRHIAAEMFDRPVPSTVPELLDAVRDFLVSLGLDAGGQHDSVAVEVGGRLIQLDAIDLDAMADALAPAEPPDDWPDAPDDKMSRSAALGRVIATGRCETDDARLDRRLAELLSDEFPVRLPIDDAIANGWLTRDLNANHHDHTI